MCLNLWYDQIGYFGKMNSTLGSVVPLAMFKLNTCNGGVMLVEEVNWQKMTIDDSPITFWIHFRGHIKTKHSKSIWSGRMIISDPMHAVLSQINFSHHLPVKKRIKVTFYWAFFVNCKLFKGYVEVKSVNYWESVEVKSEKITYYLK